MNEWLRIDNEDGNWQSIALYLSKESIFLEVNIIARLSFLSFFLCQSVLALILFKNIQPFNEIVKRKPIIN